jgi:uncharacterized protein YggE
MNDLKKPILITIIILASIWMYSLFGPALPITINSVVSNKDSLFTSSGEGKTSVIPDQAVIRMGMQVTSPTVTQGQTEVNTKINTLLDQLKGMGVEKKDIMTENYSVNPSYNTSNTITGYSINSTLVITVRDISHANSIIDTATKAGLNSVNGIEFTLSDESKNKALNQAREQAIQKAKDKAQNLARLSGIKLGRIIDVQEQENGAPRPILMNAMAKSADSTAQPTTSVEPGSTDVTIQITLTYDTK